MVTPVQGKISIQDFNRMQDDILVVDHAEGDSQYRDYVDAGDQIIAENDFGKFKKNDKVPFENLQRFFDDADAYKTIKSPEEIVKIAQEYGLSISAQPQDARRCLCVQFAVVKDGEFIKDIYGDNMSDPSINVAVIRHEFSKIKEALGFELILPAEVAVRMAKHGATYNSNTAVFSFNLGGNQSFFDLEHPNKKAVFELGKEDDDIVITLTDDTGTKKYNFSLSDSAVREVK